MKNLDWNKMAYVAAATALLPAWGYAAAPQKSERPNVIFILMDDLGYGEIGCYGQTKIETPHIDALRAHGIMFTQFYSGSPVSAPSRCVLMTGMHSGHAQIRGNDEVPSRGAVWSHDSMTVNPRLEGQYPLAAGTLTLGRLMQQAGYATGCVGKWGLGYPGSTGTPDKQGFDFFFGYNCQRMAHSYYPPFLWRNDVRVPLDGNRPIDPATHKWHQGDDPYNEANYAQYVQKTYACDVMYDELEGFVTREREHPFFLMWTTTLPHVSLQAPARWVDYYRKKFGDETPYTGKQGYYPCRYPHATYAAMISYFDEQVGRLVAKLKELGIYENTLIIFTSDNGPTFNGGSDSPWFNSAGPFKSEQGWGKCYVKEGGIRVPFIASWPGHIKEGASSPLIAGFQDMMPTFASLAGLGTPVSDGLSILPTLTGQGRQTKHPFLYWEFPENEGSRAIRMGNWKLILSNIHKGPLQIELYNLKTDLREQHNLASRYPRRVKQLISLMRTSYSPSSNPRFYMKFE